jgi:hypothetical protein
VIRLHVVQAEYGDCFILESEIGKKYVSILIDGGPYQTFEKHLKPTLKKLPLNGKLDLVVLSHIDNDHIIGLLDLLNEIKKEKQNKTKDFIKILNMWHNSFKNLLLLPDEPVKIITKYFQDQRFIERKMILDSLIMKGYQQGTDLTALAISLKIPINQGFGELIDVENNVKSTYLNHIKLMILGPTKRNIERLRKEWHDWFTKKYKSEKSKSELVQILDKSIPNLASIMFLAEIENRKILFTGDGVGQDIVEILSKNNMLDKNGRFHVDILKVPHHGSDRNTTQEFFNTIVAEYYIISANGRDDNPSLDTLRRIIQSKNSEKRNKKIILTNMTPNVKNVLLKHDRNKYGYEYIILEKGSDYLTITL